MAARICDSCGTRNPAQARFCMSCGSALERRCPSCGTMRRPRQASACPAAPRSRARRRSAAPPRAGAAAAARRRAAPGGAPPGHRPVRRPLGLHRGGRADGPRGRQEPGRPLPAAAGPGGRALRRHGRQVHRRQRDGDLRRAGRARGRRRAGGPRRARHAGRDGRDQRGPRREPRRAASPCGWASTPARSSPARSATATP